MADILREAGSLPSRMVSSVDEEYRFLLNTFGECGPSPEAKCSTCQEYLIMTHEVRAPPGWRPMTYNGHYSGMGHVHNSAGYPKTLSGRDAASGSEASSTPEPSDRYKPADGYGPLPPLSPNPSDVDEAEMKARERAERKEAEEAILIQLRAERERAISDEVRRKQAEQEEQEREQREKLRWDCRYAPSSMRSTAPQEPEEGVWYSHAL